MKEMRVLLANPANGLVNVVRLEESRWNRYRVWPRTGMKGAGGSANRSGQRRGPAARHAIGFSASHRQARRLGPPRIGRQHSRKLEDVIEVAE
jgi:hypothetical protein